MKVKTALGAAVILTAGFLLAARYRGARSLPSDFRDAPKQEESTALGDLRSTTGSGGAEVKVGMPQAPVTDVIGPSQKTSRTDKNETAAFKKGDEVFYGGDVREILAIDNTGYAILKRVPSHYSQCRVSLKEISLAVDSFGGFKKRDEVFYGGDVREILAIDNTGYAILKDNSMYSQCHVSLKEISLVVK